MVEGAQSFKRLVLGLQPSAQERNMLLAVELANLLHLELLGVFLEDTSLRDLARMPLAREFRTPAGGWQPIDLDRLSQDLDIAARSAKRAFTEAARSLLTKWQFEVLSGPTPETMASILRAEDIVIVTEPQSPVERATQQFASLIDAAFRSAAAVMLVPAHIARGTGPIVAIAATSNDPSIQTATSIAMATREELIIVETQGASFSPMSREQQARLVVMTRGVSEDAVALMIASTRRIPVLVVEPLKAEQVPPD